MRTLAVTAFIMSQNQLDLIKEEKKKADDRASELRRHNDRLMVDFNAKRAEALSLATRPRTQ